MDKLIRYASFIANSCLFISGLLFVVKGYNQEILFGILLMAVASLSLLALCSGPDIEERRLTRKLRKARLNKELADIERGDSIKIDQSK